MLYKCTVVASHQLVHTKGWRRYSFFSCFQNNSYRIINPNTFAGLVGKVRTPCAACFGDSFCKIL